jgi:Ca-activated chloride channel family protein
VREFIDDQPTGTRIGLIAFAGYAEMIAAPTTDKDQLRAAVDGLTTGRGTAIGSAILRSVDAIAAINPSVKPIGPDEVPVPAQDEQTMPLPAPTNVQPPTAAPIPDIVVLLTDGANTRGVRPMDAAKAAGDRGIRVFSIGFGTSEPTRMVCTREQLGADAFTDDLPYGRGDVAQFLVVDDATMKAVATATGGTYSPASDRAELQSVLAKLPPADRHRDRDGRDRPSPRRARRPAAAWRGRDRDPPAPLPLTTVALSPVVLSPVVLSSVLS